MRWVRMNEGPLKGKRVHLFDHQAEAEVQSGYADYTDAPEQASEPAAEVQTAPAAKPARRRKAEG